MRDLSERPQPYQKPLDTDGVVCPESYNKGTIHTPEKVYDVRQPDGKTVRRGILSSHRHRGRWFDECEYTGHPVPVVPKPTGKKE